MTALRISASSYSNTAPLIWSFLYGSQRGKIEIILDTAPARSAELLAQNRVDAALVPVIAFQLLENVRLVPNVCVGAKQKVQSVCLVTEGADLREVKSVALDISSKTSVALTKIIFREFYGFEPTWQPAKPNIEEMLETADCALLIGDPALTIDEKVYRKFDLVEVWRNFTGYGFVFAMWMAPESKAEKAQTIDFAAVRDEGLQNSDQIIANYRKEIPLSTADFHRYLNENISYTIDDSMQKGLELYFALAHQHGLIENRKDLLFIEK